MREMTDTERHHMFDAYAYAALSNDQSTQNGAVIISRHNGDLLVYGYNHIPNRLAKPERFDRPLKYDYTIHAERHAIYNAWRTGVDEGIDMYCCWAACKECAMSIAQYGVRTLYRHFHPGHAERDDWNRSIEVGDSIMSEMGVEIVTLTGKVGTKILFNGKWVEV